ncbi:TIGR00341 family protein [Qipengyuania flava]|uniref:TIGR00341 family protein n=1 Tax=Qipengyuania flava TaxID=192812 RepID=UPI001C625421|nr:TIGR00341 family protein [Qipengyuania flava]QYJ07507.1 TIGR00341 family protein [Qipengyuania flava]
MATSSDSKTDDWSDDPSPDADASGKGYAKRGPISRFTVLRALAETRAWWRDGVIADLDHVATIERVRGESLLTSRYIFMTAMSAGIAILGLLLSSPAVVIGAMLLSPLMNPIIGTGFSLATGDADWLRRCGKALVAGSLFAIFFCALIVFFSPLQTVTTEIAARTRPNLFDLLVALFSALAGSYAVIRGREGTIVGVAIATALMPPLAVVGFGLATMNWTVFGGALGLFITNLVTIGLTAAVMARLYGFQSDLTHRQSRLQSVVIVAVFIALAVPLGFSLRTIAWEANGQRIVNQEVSDAFTDRARVDQPIVNWDADPITVSASVFTPEFRADADQEVSRRLERRLGREVLVTIDQFQVGTDPGAAEQAALAQARAREAAEASERQIADLAQNLALLAGVERSDVMLDRESRRAQAVAQPLEGLTLSGYRELERRLERSTPGWTVELRPPLAPLPDITVGEEGLDADNAIRLALVGWAARRTGVRVTLTGSEANIATLVAALGDDAAHVDTQVSGRGSRVATAWSTAASAGNQ